ncbi:MAG TPA: hypothetical protein VK915_00090 [Gaiellaceae bacterium]|nr:hypothetical protein [Gaiellaceae bacterium]
MEALRAVVDLPGEGHRVGTLEFLARSASTPRFNVAVVTVRPGSEGPAPNVHRAATAGFDLRLEGG